MVDCLAFSCSQTNGRDYEHNDHVNNFAEKSTMMTLQIDIEIR